MFYGAWAGWDYGPREGGSDISRCKVRNWGMFIGPNTRCDIEIGQVPSCAKCCILRINRVKPVEGSNSIQRGYFYLLVC
jgi:hypothetical protein